MCAYNKNSNYLSFKNHFENPETPFTELISLLKFYKTSFSSDLNTCELAYSAEALQAMDQHANNSIKLLLPGLEGLGCALAVLTENKNLAGAHISHLSHLIQIISNLTEALCDLRNDISHQLNPANSHCWHETATS